MGTSQQFGLYLIVPFITASLSPRQADPIQPPLQIVSFSSLPPLSPLLPLSLSPSPSPALPLPLSLSPSPSFSPPLPTSPLSPSPSSWQLPRFIPYLPCFSPRKSSSTMLPLLEESALFFTSLLLGFEFIVRQLQYESDTDQVFCFGPMIQQQCV